ncbi:MAG: hypothetical protein A3F92_04330 [Candidatus Rokubacteria bacterium RIFCSPLOWO2_12_FULL_71_22]|nr:MAG: hypothetical protein A3F92_04330 [Candidatus Rokubacteria bacterium RIFCSPLOWO2_12_FULL_71_22]
MLSGLGMEESAMTFREMTALAEVPHASAPAVTRPRGVGRPSTVAQYAQQIQEWLRAEPTVSGAEILRRVRLTGYRGGKSALYELVRRLRLPVAASQ